jgi:hypothetical protein
LIDWVRTAASESPCRIGTCDRDARDTDIGPVCLTHYLKEPTCRHPGCHRPQADGRTGKRYIGLYFCWEHLKTKEGESADVAWARWAVESRSSWD